MALAMLAWVDSTNTLYRYRSTGWRPVVATRSEYGTGTHNYGGGLGPVTTNITYAVPFSSPPALAFACNDPRFTLYYGGASTAGFTLSSLASTAGITLSLSVSWTVTGPAS